eukprot:218719_1
MKTMETELKVKTNTDENNDKRNVLIFAVSCFVLLIIVIIIIVAVEEGKASDKPDDIPGDNSTNVSNWTAWSLPIPGVPYEYWYQGRLQNMTLNKDVLYYKNETTVKCIVEFDENGSLSNESYIQVIDDLAGNYKINSIIVAAAPSFEELDSNCTLFPAVIVNKIINDTKNGILTMYVSEAEIFDYFDEIDCNITNGTLFDTGIDVGDIKKIKSLEEYFSNATTKSLNNYTNTTIFYSNVTYTELELLCYNISENGTELNELPVINGICNGVSAIDYFGTEYGFDELSFGNVTLGQNNTNFSLSDDIFDFDNTSTPIRRRLRRRRSRRRGRIR